MRSLVLSTTLAFPNPRVTRPGQWAFIFIFNHCASSQGPTNGLDAYTIGADGPKTSSARSPTSITPSQPRTKHCHDIDLLIFVAAVIPLVFFYPLWYVTNIYRHTYLPHSAHCSTNNRDAVMFSELFIEEARVAEAVWGEGEWL